MFPRLLTRRKGFTLIEVALAVTVGLMIATAAIYGYNNMKQQAGNAQARTRVAMASGTIAEYAAASGGSYPVSDAVGTGRFTAMWNEKHPDEARFSPWGGPTGEADGVVELAPFPDGTADAASAPDKTGELTADRTRAASLIYASIDRSQRASIRQSDTGEPVGVKGYVISIHDPDGVPWFSVVGGR